MNNIEAIYPLSPVQQGMLFHSLYDPTSGDYTVQLLCTLKKLDTPAFKRAWQYILQRHPVLQSAFVWERQAEALQVVCRQVEFPWEEQDWRGLSPDEQRDRLTNYIDEDRRRGFDLAKPPLMRCALFQTDDDTFEFVWTQHHLVLDGWSRSIVLKELLSLYEGFIKSQEPELVLPRPYKHYITWLKQQDVSKSEAFWRQTLEGFTAPTPLVKAAPAINGEEGSGKHGLYLSAATTAALTSLTRRHKLTLNTFVEGAWSILLSRYSGKPDVVFGETLSGRPPTLEGAEFMVGVLINVLPVRVKISDDNYLVPWLQQLQQQQVQMREFEHSPLVQVQAWSEVPHGVPMFESILTFENYPVDTALKEWSGSVDINEVRIIDKTNYPLIVTATPGPRLALSFTYDRSRFDDSTMGRMLEHLSVLLNEIAANAERRVCELPVFTTQKLKAEYVAPRTELEQMLADLWQEILQVEKVGIYDHFVDLGGHTLPATRIITRLNKAFQMELPITSLFESANIAGLAATIEETLLKELEEELAEPATEVMLFDQELLEQKNYWVERLSGCLAQVTLPVDYRKERTSEAKGVIQTRLDAAVYERLRALTGDSAFLTYTALLSALEVCMLQYTGNREVLVGSPAQPELGRANALVVRNQLDERATFKELLEQVRETLLAGYSRAEYPYERLAQELGWSRAPFDVLVGLSGFHGELPEVGQSLTLCFRQAGGELLATLEYRAESYQEASVRALWQQFERVLGAGLAAGERRLAELGQLSEAEQWQVVQEWNQSAISYPGERCIHELFEEQVARDAEATAVVYEEQTLSYGELNRRANRLAHYLLKYGLQPGTRVGIYLEHSPTEVAALLAVLKAGGTYVPLEPAHPSTRLAYIIDDAQLELVLTQQQLASGLPPEAWPVLVDEDSEVWEETEESNPVRQARVGDLAYVIYTSGSTGRPKGVEISHRALVNYIWWAKEVYLQGESLTFALYSSLAFDLTVTSLYVPLVSGNQLIIYGWEGKEPPLLRIVEEGQVGVLKLTPSHLALLRGRALRPDGVRRLIVGGEALSTELARAVWESFGGTVEILNEYGPTETTVGCMLHRYEVEQDQRAAVPIGRAAGNMQIYLLDEQQQPVAENVLGELYIGGDGLAQGYLGQPGLTAERFIANPFVAGERMYKSGDLARRLADGKLEYVGRRDEQVKFHGYRVELAEIEWALKQHAQVQESVVRVERDEQGQEVMLGYYVSRQELEVGELRQFLKQYLIEETIPNVFVQLKELPLTLNGKVDHQALPTLAENRQKLRREYREPQTETEQALAGIWATSLGVERVGAEDNFFELGGHSLIAIQLLSRIRDGFQVDLPLRSVFDAPTVAGLARKIEQTLQI